MTFQGCTTTRIYCRPNCPPGRRVLSPHRVVFASAEAARAAGYRPCKVCRPDDASLPEGAWVPRAPRRRTATAG